MAVRNAKPKKKQKRILKRMQIKLWLVFGVICVLFVVLMGRLMYIQRTSGDRYEKKVLSQQDYDSKIIPYQRGNITDSHGTILATSIDVYNVILDCKVLNSYEDSIATTISAVTTCFPEISYSTIREKLDNSPTAQYVVLAKRVPYEKMASFLDLKDQDGFKGNVYGIWFEKEYIRSYPYGSLAAATIGYASSGNVGVFGLENKYSSTLNGVNGRTYGYLNTDSNLEQTTIEAVNGYNIVSSLDVNIQSIVEKAIADWNKEFESPDSPGSQNTAVLVMNPKNGEVLAMAQFPFFDLSDPYDLSDYFTEEELAVMPEEDKLKKLNSIWQNFCVTNTYEPGSTAKPFTVACGLETGVLSGNEAYLCNGYEEVGGHTIHCVNRNGHGMQSIGDALNNSCNDALMQMSYAIGPERFAQNQSLFGFGQKTYIDLPGETSTVNLIYHEDGLQSKVNLATNSFGQNFNCTMIQMGSAFCSLVNGGNLYQPHLITRITDSNGNTVKEIEPILQKKTVSKEVSDMLKRYLKDVVETGTGKTAGVAGYSIGGKTGTAEKLPRGTHNYLVSFIGFAPVEDPQVVVYCIIDVPNTPDQAHSSFAQTIVHNIFEQILPYMNIESSLTEEEEKEAANAITESLRDPSYEAIEAPDTTDGLNGDAPEEPEDEE